MQVGGFKKANTLKTWSCTSSHQSREKLRKLSMFKPARLLYFIKANLNVIETVRVCLFDPGASKGAPASYFGESVAYVLF